MRASTARRRVGRPEERLIAADQAGQKRVDTGLGRQVGDLNKGLRAGHIAGHTTAAAAPAGARRGLDAAFGRWLVTTLAECQTLVTKLPLSA